MIWVALTLVSCGRVQTHDGAPFDLQGRHMRFVGDEGAGRGSLLLSDVPLECEDITFGAQISVGPELYEASHGLLLGFELDDPGDPFVGLFDLTSATGYDAGEFYGVDVFDAWIELKRVDERAVGEFDTEWWSGRIRAKTCRAGDLPIDCSPSDVDAFQGFLLQRYCEEWGDCSDDPCPVSEAVGATQVDCPNLDPVAAEECLCGAWSCNTAFPGFEFLELPAACISVCG